MDPLVTVWASETPTPTHKRSTARALMDFIFSPGFGAAVRDCTVARISECRDAHMKHVRGRLGTPERIVHEKAARGARAATRIQRAEVELTDAGGLLLADLLGAVAQRVRFLQERLLPCRVPLGQRLLPEEQVLVHQCVHVV